MDLSGFAIRGALGVGGYGTVFFAVATRRTSMWEKDERVAIKKFEDNSRSTASRVAQNAQREYDLMKSSACETVVILQGLNFIHDRLIVHKDIKLANVILMIDKDGKIAPKIGDFGISMRVKVGGKVKSGAGSAFYASPEVRQDLPHGTPADVFSWGISMYEMLRADAYTPEEGTPLEIEDPMMERMVATCLRDDPDRRPTAAELLRDPAFYHGFFPAALPLSRTGHDVWSWRCCLRRSLRRRSCRMCRAGDTGRTGHGSRRRNPAGITKAIRSLGSVGAASGANGAVGAAIGSIGTIGAF